MNFIKLFVDLNQLKNIENFNQFKVPSDQLFDINEATGGAPFRVALSRVKRQKLKRTDSKFSPFLSMKTSLYSPFYVLPPGFVPRSPHSSEDEVDDHEYYRVNGMPPNFRE
ncbi:unnamed protein product [Adineta ricciae]|uniref:Uncharacterized protein n=1 Tax=Adineta ricciae TaxID=249248 RepID=A0A815I7E3_ADIRI|nr:unnamed protein product [Adineta ricciae]